MNSLPNSQEALNEKVLSFWGKIDLAFLELVQEIFEHCYTCTELNNEKDMVKHILILRYPKNPGRGKLLADIKAKFIERYKFLLQLQRDNEILDNPAIADQGGASRRTVRDQGKRGAK